MRRGLKGGDQHVRAAARGKVLRETTEKTVGHATPVRSPVEREALPRVQIPLATTRRQVRWVRQDQVEPPESSGQIGLDGLQR